jgi:hypothetical protein
MVLLEPWPDRDRLLGDLDRFRAGPGADSADRPSSRSSVWPRSPRAPRTRPRNGCGRSSRRSAGIHRPGHAADVPAGSGLPFAEVPKGTDSPFHAIVVEVKSVAQAGIARRVPRHAPRGGAAVRCHGRGRRTHRPGPGRLRGHGPRGAGDRPRVSDPQPGLATLMARCEPAVHSGMGQQRIACDSPRATDLGMSGRRGGCGSPTHHWWHQVIGLYVRLPLVALLSVAMRASLMSSRTSLTIRAGWKG